VYVCAFTMEPQIRSIDVWITARHDHHEHPSDEMRMTYTYVLPQHICSILNRTRQDWTMRVLSVHGSNLSSRSKFLETNHTPVDGVDIIVPTTQTPMNGNITDSGYASDNDDEMSSSIKKRPMLKHTPIMIAMTFPELVATQPISTLIDAQIYDNVMACFPNYTIASMLEPIPLLYAPQSEDMTSYGMVECGSGRQLHTYKYKLMLYNYYKSNEERASLYFKDLVIKLRFAF